MKRLSSCSDSELTRSIQSSDANAFKILYFRYYESLLKFIYHRLHSEESAKDIVQDVFTRLWDNRQSLDENKSIKAYLYRIANNLVIDNLRKKSSKETSVEELTHQYNDPADNSFELRAMVKTAINNLPENLRLVFILNRYEGLKYKEIAEICHISVKTVEKRMSQALQMLREQLS